MDILDSFSKLILEVASKNEIVALSLLCALFQDKDQYFIVKILDDLLSNGYLVKESTNFISDDDSTVQFSITPKGIAYLEIEDKQVNKEKIEKRSSFTNNLRAWLTFGIAIIGLALSVYNAIQSNVSKQEEVILISNVNNRERYDNFDGTWLNKEISFTISNNSQISVSFVDLAILLAGDPVRVIYEDNNYIMPINIPPNTSQNHKVSILRFVDYDLGDVVEKEISRSRGLDGWIPGPGWGRNDIDKILHDSNNNQEPFFVMKLTTSKGKIIEYAENW